MSLTYTAPISQDGLASPRRYLAVALLLLAIVVVVLDGAIANVALPSIALSLQAQADSTVWVVSAYQLAVLVAILPCGALGEIYGARRVFLIGVALFTAASAACALAGDLPVLILARFAQGLGAGAIMALAMMNLRQALPQHMLGPIIGINAMIIAISSAAGPGIAGAILSVASWPWLFAVNIPLGLVVLFGGGLLGHVEGARRKLNAKVLLANTAMFILFFSGADRIATAPISGAALIVASLACLFGLLRLERNSDVPLIPTDLLAAPAFRVSVIASVFCFCGQMLGTIALPFYLQHRLHMTPVLAGLYMMAWPAATAVIAPVSGRLANRVKTAWLCSIGGGLMALGLLVAGLTPPDPRGIAFLVGAVIAGLGFGLFQTPNNRILLLSAPKARSGAAGAMQGTARLLGQTLGGISMSIIFATLPLATALNFAVAISGGCAAMASMVSLSRARYEVVGKSGAT
ncbi:MFS transporter [Rhizobium sp. MC63]|uniref:MFS transporter n=1 Tax=Rhizobium mulingense TaxID=3031128 RepID=A0ACC6MWA9_9HYPH|nr:MULTISPECIES: MFS transporter [unclassified Rhizobium]MDF0694976.1 MFS transporter [Rhizobium sp. MC63]MEA3517659.1 MFS transporter [Rhizobium sp. MJ31]MEB3045844.1 MFS transporter [Rhizobium sp. MJ21]